MYILAPYVRACVDQGVLVLLDLKRDRYFSIDAATSPPIADVVEEGTGSAANRLLSKGLIQMSSGQVLPPRGRPSALTNELPELAYRQLGTVWTDWAAMLAACARAELSLRSRRLDRTFGSFEHRKKRRRVTDKTLSQDVARFERMRPWYPRGRVCLFDSLALMNFLLSRGHAPSFVMGVRARPFFAHCWVESGATSLNDVAESCRSYTPIAWV